MPDQTIDLADLRRILREAAGVDHDVDLDGDMLDTEFDALGIDSLAVMETAAKITREYGVEIDDDELTQATTARLLLDLVNGR